MAWMTANWLVLKPWVVSRSTATRVTPGAICLSSSSHFPLMLYSKIMNPVTLPPGRARLSTKPAPTGSTTIVNTIGTVRVACSIGPTARGATGQDDVGRERGQFRRVSANFGGISRGPANVDPPRCGRWSSPIAPAPAGTPRHGPEIAASSAAAGRSTPTRRMRSGCCARAASGHAAAAPPRSVMTSRRLIRSPRRRGRAAIGGTVRPSAFAVLRLTTNSNLVGFWTGRSAGFVALENAIYIVGRLPACRVGRSRTTSGRRWRRRNGQG